MRTRLQWIYGIGQIENHDLVYGTYIGNGDSSSYKNLVKADPYNGVVSVRKGAMFRREPKSAYAKQRRSSKYFLCQSGQDYTFVYFSYCPASG